MSSLTRLNPLYAPLSSRTEHNGGPQTGHLLEQGILVEKKLAQTSSNRTEYCTKTYSPQESSRLQCIVRSSFDQRAFRRINQSRANVDDRDCATIKDRGETNQWMTIKDETSLAKDRRSMSRIAVDDPSVSPG